MDFMNRGVRSSQNTGHQVDQSTHSTLNPGISDKKINGAPKNNVKWGKIGRIGSVSFLFALTVLIALAFLSLVLFKGASNESRFIDTSKYQAVFLNGGQVYFGKISELNDKFMRVYSVYYLRVNQQVQPDSNASSAANDISLVKLGCELHAPQDEMLLNREQIIFWENLKDDGQVAKAIVAYQKQFPDGQKCEDQASGSGAGQNNVAEPAPSNSTTPSTPTPTTPPSTTPTTPTPTTPPTTPRR